MFLRDIAVGKFLTVCLDCYTWRNAFLIDDFSYIKVHKNEDFYSVQDYDLSGL